MSHLNHIIELKKRVILSSILYVVIFLSVFIASRSLFSLVNQPLLNALPKAYQIISTSVTAPFSVLMKFSLFLATLITMPVILYQSWAFISPALYQREKSLIKPLFIVSLSLFYIGLLFAFGIVCPLALSFFYHFAPDNITVLTDLSSYYGFIFRMMLVFGLSFQIPIVIFLLLRLQIVSVSQLAQKRRMIIIGCLIVGMLLTPPDVVSQVLLAIPLFLLFELGMLLHKWLTPKKQLLES